jgi:hypothetical protein
MLTYRRHRYLTRWNRRAVFAVAILLLLALSWRALLPKISTDHAKEIAAKALPRYAAGIRPASLRTYSVSAAELAQYLRGESGRSGHLVTYTCEVATPQPHEATFAAFVDEADSVREFVPDKNLGLFAANYGVDYRMQ